MKIGYLDAFSGISGDMTVGALLDAGADAEALLTSLDSLGTGALFQVEKTRRRGIAATKFRVLATETHSHRHLPQILDLLERVQASERAKCNARAVFKRLGAAEAKVHDIPLERVHFHEVGAVDSICDIVGACVGFDLLDLDEIWSSPLNLGSGTITAEHGVLPVPAPATAELVTGHPVYARGPETELTTPTGAAIAVTLATRFDALPPMRIVQIGYGAGDKDFGEHANVLRLVVGELAHAVEATTVSVIEANIDDSNPQVLGYAMEQLLEQGALDVTLEALLMKKNRPGTQLRAITRIEDQERLAELILRETSTLGLRITRSERRVRPRQIIEVETPHGKVRGKVSADGTFAPEYDDCRKLALETGTPLKQILTEASYAYLKNSR